MTYRIGQRFRHADGTLFHLRGYVDHRLVLRSWSRRHQAWRYEVILEYATECGLFKPV